nr:MFS transporter [Paenibacillus lemnae]
MFISLAVRICTQMQNTILPLYVLDLGYSALTAGLMTTVFTLTALIFRPMAGSLMDKKGRFVILFIGTALFGITSGLYIFVMPIGLFIVIRAISGIGFSWNGTAISTMASDVLPDSRMSEGIGYLGLSQTIAMAVAPGLALALKDAYGFKSLFTAVFSVMVLVFIIGFMIRYEKNSPYIQDRSTVLLQQSESSGIDSEANVNKRITWLNRIFEADAWKPSIFMLFVAIANCSVGTFLAVYAIEKGILNFGLFYTVSAVMMAIVRLGAGRISMKFGSAVILIPGFILLSISLAGIVISSSLPLLLTSAVLYGIAMGALQPEINAMAVVAAAKERRGSANATFLMMIDIGTGLGAAVWGWIAYVTGTAWVFILSSAVSAAALLIYILGRKKKWVR